MKRSFPAVLAILFLGSGLRAESAPDAATLTQLVKDFLAGATVNDIKVHERFWADDLIYTSSSGRRFGKAEILNDVRSAPSPGGEKEPVYDAEEFQIRQYGDVAVVAFRLVATAENEGKPEVRRYLNSGTFVKRDGRWQVVCWQATKMDSTAPE